MIFKQKNIHDSKIKMLVLFENNKMYIVSRKNLNKIRKLTKKETLLMANYKFYRVGDNTYTFDGIENVFSLKNKIKRKRY